MGFRMRQKAQLPRGWKNCRNCFKPFKPAPNKIKDQVFCPGGNCRKEFWKHGGVSLHKLKVHVQQWAREALKEELAKLGITGRAA